MFPCFLRSVYQIHYPHLAHNCACGTLAKKKMQPCVWDCMTAGVREVLRDVLVWSSSDCWKSENYSRHTMKLKKVAESWWLKPIRTEQRQLSQINESWEVDTAEDRSYNYSTVISWMMGLPYWKNDRLTSAGTLVPQLRNRQRRFLPWRWWASWVWATTPWSARLSLWPLL